MVVRGCDWPPHTASKSCQIVLLKVDSDLICEQHKSHRIRSVKFWFGPLPYAVLNQIQEGFLSLRPQVEQSYHNVTLTSL